MSTPAPDTLLVSPAIRLKAPNLSESTAASVPDQGGFRWWSAHSREIRMMVPVIEGS